MKFEFIKIQWINALSLESIEIQHEQATEESPPLIAVVELNRQKKLNAMNDLFFSEIFTCFNWLSANPNVRSIVLTGNGRHFTAGLDLQDPTLMNLISSEKSEFKETGRRGMALNKLVRRWQSSFTAIEQCSVPVIVGVDGYCIGAGMDMIAACDIRYCTEKAKFSVKEVDIGLAADLGTLQRFQKIIGNQSAVREICLTARLFGAKEAELLGLVSGVFASKEQMMTEGLMKCAQNIALKSPIAIVGTKKALNYSRDHSVADGLEFIANWNACMLQSQDIPQSILSGGQLSKVRFSKL